MPGETFTGSGKTYLNIIEGTFRQKTDKTVEGAKLREWKLANGDSGEKWELVYKNWTGKIHEIKFEETEYGEMCKIFLDDAIITLNTDSKYFQDAASKICSADLTKEITFHPYDFLTEDKQRKKGIKITQGSVVLTSHFYDFEKKENLHGFPVVDQIQKDKLKKNYWKVFFAEVSAFLVEKLSNLEIPKTFKEQHLENVKNIVTGEISEDPKEEVEIDNLPF